MSCSRNRCSGLGNNCIYGNSVHMHTLINGIPVILKLAEFDSNFRLPIGDCPETKKNAHTKLRCCPQCKCGSGEDPCNKICAKESVVSIKFMDTKSACSTKSAGKRKKPRKDKRILKRRSFCVFKRKDEGVPKKTKERPKPRPMPKPKPKEKPKVKRLETVFTYSTETIKGTETAETGHSLEECSTSVETNRSPPRRPPKEKPTPRKALPSEKRTMFSKDTKPNHCRPPRPRKIRKGPTCRPVFKDAATSTATEYVRHFIIEGENPAFKMGNKMEPTISVDTERTIGSLDTDCLSFPEENPKENSVVESMGEEVKYRFIACHLKEGPPPESLASKSMTTEVTRDCLETSMSIYAPSLSSMVPYNFDESHEILSTIVEHASSAGKDEKGTGTPCIAFSTLQTSTSAQTCLIDYELFKGYGCNPKMFQKEYVIEETLTNGHFLQKTDSSTAEEQYVS